MATVAYSMTSQLRRGDLLPPTHANPDGLTITAKQLWTATPIISSPNKPLS